MGVLGSWTRKERKLFFGWDKGLREMVVGGELLFFFFGARDRALAALRFPFVLAAALGAGAAFGAALLLPWPWVPAVCACVLFPPLMVVLVVVVVLQRLAILIT